MTNFTQYIPNTGYEVILAAILAATTAQILKAVLYTIVKRKFNFHILTTTGGMPSSHSACVVALTTAVGIIEGAYSIPFAISAGYAAVVMYDAAGLRRAAGKMSASLNKMMDDFYQHNVEAAGGRLKELLGHTPIEVFVGAVYGIVVAYYLHYILLK